MAFFDLVVYLEGCENNIDEPLTIKNNKIRVFFIIDDDFVVFNEQMYEKLLNWEIV